ncbi:MAG: putative lipid II flippase FtsW [Calditrichaeota bacterium]|nr:MAG: putative lipid II flippase FtsW [Calditrichota bacterium]
MDDLIKSPVGRMDNMLIATVLALSGIGVIMIFSASSAVAFEKFGSSHAFLTKHFLRIVLGIVGMLIIARIDYKKYQDYVVLLLIFSLILLILVPFVGLKIKGASRWFSIFGFSFMPSELAKFVLVIYFADFLSRKGALVRDIKKGFGTALGVVGLFAFLIFLQPDFSTAAVIGLIIFTMLYMGGAKITHFLALAAVVIPTGIAAVFTSAYRKQRVMNFIASDFENMSYQMKQAYIGLGSGGISGVGIGESKQKLMFLPEQYTDFIFAILGEELGLIGEFLVILLFLIFLARGLRTAKRSPDSFGQFLAAGITVAVVIYAFLNISVVTGLVPTTGLPLPFISYGGTSVVLTLWSVGILLNISRQGNALELQNLTEREFENENVET